MEDDLWWKTTFGGRRPLLEDDLWWKMIFGETRPSLEDDFRWRTTFRGRWPLVEANLQWKGPFGGRIYKHLIGLEGNILAGPLALKASEPTIISLSLYDVDRIHITASINRLLAKFLVQQPSLRWKFTNSEYNLRNINVPKNEDNLKNSNYLNHEDNLEFNKEDDPKEQEDFVNEDGHKRKWPQDWRWFPK